MKNKKLKNTEWAVLIVSLLLFGIGLVALFSATQSTEYGEFKKQIQWFLVSIPFLILVSLIDYDVILKFSPLFFVILLLALVGVLFTKPINGASSWFKVGDFLAIQPSELGKIVAILFFVFAVPTLLIVRQPDYGTAIAYTTAFLFMLFVSGLDKKYIILAILLVVVLVPTLYIYVLPEHAKSRIDVFLNPEQDPRGAGYNLIQSKLRIWSIIRNGTF